MDYTQDKYMVETMPFHTLEAQKLSGAFDLKSRKHATLDLDNFMQKNQYAQPEQSPKFGNAEQPTRHRQAVSQGVNKIRSKTREAPPQQNMGRGKEVERTNFDFGINRKNKEKQYTEISRKDKENSHVRGYSPHYNNQIIDYKQNRDIKNHTYEHKHTRDVSNSMLVEKSPEVMKEVHDCMNKSYEIRKASQPRSHSHTQKMTPMNEKLAEPGKIYPRNIMDRSLNNREIEIGLDIPTKLKPNVKTEFPINPTREPLYAWNTLGNKDYEGDIAQEHKNRAERIENELKKIRKEPPGHGGRGRVYSYFEEIIAEVPYYGKALKQLKEMYEWKISQLNERVGRHDIKCNEYKELADRERRLREEAERKNSVLQIEIKKQIVYVESQKAIIKDLKSRIEQLEKNKSSAKDSAGHNTTLPIGSYKLRNESRERNKIDKVFIPPLDLSRIKQHRESNKNKQENDQNIGLFKQNEFKKEEYKDELTALLEDLSH